jgi:hypothetical protein
MTAVMTLVPFRADQAQAHPRGAGCFSRTLGPYVRNGVLTLMSAVRKMTLLPALRLQSFVPAMLHKVRLLCNLSPSLASSGVSHARVVFSVEPMRT